MESFIQAIPGVSVAGFVDPSTLQSLLSSGQLVDGNGQPIQIIALTGGGDGEPASNKLWQLVSTGGEGGEGGMVMALGTTEGKYCMLATKLFN